MNYCPCVADFIFSIQCYKRTVGTILGKICIRNDLQQAANHHFIILTGNPFPSQQNKNLKIGLCMQSLMLLLLTSAALLSFMTVV